MLHFTLHYIKNRNGKKEAIGIKTKHDRCPIAKPIRLVRNIYNLESTEFPGFKMLMTIVMTII